MFKRLLPTLVYGLPIAALLATVGFGGCLLAQAVADEGSAKFFGNVGLLLAALTAIDGLALVSLLGLRALGEVE